MRVDVIHKLSPRREWDKPGTWAPLRLPSGRVTATFICPDCGRPGSLAAHEIAADGTVAQAVGCGGDDCAFHGFIQLDEWAPQ